MFKRIVLPVLLLVGVCGGAYAYEKCVAVTALSTICKNAGTASASQYTTDWSVSCGTTGVVVRGISECVNQMNISPTCSGSAATTSHTCPLTAMPLSTVAGGYCACRMIYPAVGRWYAYSSASLSNCNQNCAQYCANSFKSNPSRFLGTGQTAYLN